MKKMKNKIAALLMGGAIASAGVLPSVTALAVTNGGNFLNQGTTPFAVTVSFYDDWDSRGWCWTTTSAVSAPVVQLLAWDGETTNYNWANAETLTATTTVTDEVYFNHKAYKQDMAEGQYVYRVGDGSTWSSVGQVRVDDGKEGFSFLFTTDPQDYDETGFSAWADLVASAYETVPDAAFMANGGDVVNDSHGNWGQTPDDHDMDQWIYALDLPKSNFMNSVFMPTAGNHDSWATSFTDRFAIDYQGSTQTGGYYTFTYGDVFFAVMNTNESGSKMTAQVEWVSQQLAATDKTWKIVMMHKGAISTGDHSNDGDVAEWRNAILPVMAKYSVDLVLQGHDHVYVRSKPYLYGEANGGFYSGKVPNKEETIVTEVKEGKEITYSVEPSGTFYVTGNYAGRKSYPPVDYDETVIYPAKNPYNGKDMSIQIQSQMFMSIRITDNTLEYNAYTFDGTKAELYDTYNVKKNTHLAVEESFAALPDADDVTVFDTANIVNALESYDSLVALAKSRVSADAKTKMATFTALNLEDYKKAYPVAKGIEELRAAEASTAYSNEIRTLRRSYADLSETQKALVTNYGKLDTAEKQMIDVYAANAVSQMIVRYKSGKDKLSLAEIRLAYNGLTAEQKALVTGIEDLDLSDSAIEKERSSCASVAPYSICMLVALTCAGGIAIKRRKAQ